MGIEIERKFLLHNGAWRYQSTSKTHLVQGYISVTPAAIVRIRIAADSAFLTLKGKRTNYSATEFEYPLPLEDARQMLTQMCPLPPVEKWRHIVLHHGHRWEIDEFLGTNAGLYLAEIELESASAEFPRPQWLGAEVSHDPRYTNASLAQRPYSTWER
ncbi:MAG: CYTH domain-containing protein [Desulfuromonadaceae bacterium]|nr:CYTH domain-containing protein [Desulfuromonadaceae bacterium]